MKKLIIFLFSFSTMFAQKLDIQKESGEYWTVEEYKTYYLQKETESDLYPIASNYPQYDFWQFAVAHTSIDKTEFKLYPIWLNNNAEYLSQISPDFSWDNKFVIPYLEDVKFEFVFGDDSRAIAQAHSPVSDDIRIIINIDKWDKLNAHERAWLFVHEFAHEAYNLQHGDTKIMYPLLPKELKDETVLDDLDLLFMLSGSFSQADYIKTEDMRVRLYTVRDDFLQKAVMDFLVHIAYNRGNNTQNIFQYSRWPKLLDSRKPAFPEARELHFHYFDKSNDKLIGGYYIL